jgi:hypothetical protein
MSGTFAAEHRFWKITGCRTTRFEAIDETPVFFVLNKGVPFVYLHTSGRGRRRARTGAGSPPSSEKEAISAAASDEAEGSCDLSVRRKPGPPDFYI